MVIILQKKNTTCISLQQIDEEVLYKIISFIGNIKVRQYESLGKKYSKIQFNSQKISQSLHNLGCVQTKSLILQFPTEEQVPVEFQHHFIRGYFDGDGSIYFSKDNIPTISIISTIMFNKKLKEILLKSCVLRDNKIRMYKNNITSDIRFSGNNQVLSIKNYLYKDATIYLERKYNKLTLVN